MVTKLVGMRIAQLRHERGLSQLEFASRINMARTYFAEVETGKRNVSMRNLEKITRGLDVTLSEFFNSDIFDPLYASLIHDDRHKTREIRYAHVMLPPIE